MKSKWLKGAYKAKEAKATVEAPKPGSRAARIALVSEGKNVPGRTPRPSSKAIRYGGSS